MLRLLSAALGAAMLLLPVAAWADDWTADKLRGQVVQLVDNQWQPLKRGMVVPDSRIIRTMKTGKVTFMRGTETVDLGPDTQIQIYDKAGAKPFTTVKQYFGSVSVEADVRKVQHFGVDTPFLAAVVKGTRFTVTSGKGGSSVSVRRGHVAVENLHTHSHVTLSVGQTATVGAGKADGETAVSGSGKLPAVVDGSGNPVAGASSNGVKVNVADGLVTASAGDDGVSVGIGDVARVNVGGGSLLNVSVGGPGNSGSGGGSSGNGSGSGSNSASGNGNSGHSGGLLNLNIGGIHLGL
jgi:hypothetical protein